ncbi:DUF1778 domain-containing protein [Bdellovibrionota bacterium FG-1]
MAQPNAQKMKKTDRVDLRLDQNQKETIEKAAELNGMSTSSYMVRVAFRAAKRDLADEENLTLSNRDRDLFLANLENPPKATLALKKAMQHVKKAGL